jgi:hypothetical protein
MTLYIIHVRLLTEDGDEARAEDGSIWGQTKFEIMQRCRRKHKLLPSSTFCIEPGNLVWTNVYINRN